MRGADRPRPLTPGSARARQTRRGLVAAVTSLLLTAGCVVDEPAIETTSDRLPATVTSIAVATVAVPTPQFRPTEPPLPPTPIPTAVVDPTPQTPLGPTPIPALTPTADVLPSPVAAGPVAVPVGGTTTFILDSPRPILQLPGHTLIYVDENRLAEVDIFTPVATADGTLLAGYDDVVAVLLNAPTFADVRELESVTIAGLATRVFEGSVSAEATASGDVFATDPDTLDNEFAGWVPPGRLRMWVIDAPAGPVVLTAESLENPGQYSDAVRLATEVLTTITFGS